LTQAEYTRLNIKTVSKNLDPPNVPQVRPLENFWAILKRKVYSDGWTAKSIEYLINKNKERVRKYAN
jgi:hypothetical protein